LDNMTATEDKEYLKLTEWELKNLHLPPVTTVTLYEGTAPVEYLRNRLTMMLNKNPWLTSRIIKEGTDDGIVAMAYSKSFDAEDLLDQHLSVFEPGDVGLSLSMPYEEIVHCLLPIQCAGSKQATDTDEALFKVAIVPIEVKEKTGDQAVPLQQAITLPGFALVVSMNHTLGDGHTYYKLYSMLSTDTEVKVLEPVRVSGFEEAKIEVTGKKENAMYTSIGLGLGIVGTYMGTKITRRKPQNVCIHTVDPAWTTHEKAKAKQAGRVPFVSTNDALTSWFFRKMKSDLNIMVANFRSRKPSILNLEEYHVGNYEANVPYFPGDVETPTLIRQSIRSADGGFRAYRAGSPPTEIPNFLKLLRNKCSLITNWATFYRDVVLHDNASGNEHKQINPKLHLPIMETKGLLTSVWNSCIIFRPRLSELAILMITRRFDSGMLIQLKQHDGLKIPTGARIV